MPSRSSAGSPEERSERPAGARPPRPPRAWRGVRQVRASEDVATQILSTFYARGLRPGEWLGTEAELAARFGVSRVTIRDAVSALAARGLIEVRVGARGGLRVARSDPDRLIDAFSIQLRLMGLSRDELFEAMSAIEPVTAALAAERASADDLQALGELVRRARSVIDDPVEFARLGVAFHQMVADMSGNRALRASLAALRSPQLEHMGPPPERRIAERIAALHEAIAAAIAAHDPAAARRHMDRHLAAMSAAAAAGAQLALV